MYMCRFHCVCKIQRTLIHPHGGVDMCRMEHSQARRCCTGEAGTEREKQRGVLRPSLTVRHQVSGSFLTRSAAVAQRLPTTLRVSSVCVSQNGASPISHEGANQNCPRKHKPHQSPTLLTIQQCMFSHFVQTAVVTHTTSVYV